MTPVLWHSVSNVNIYILQSSDWGPWRQAMYVWRNSKARSCNNCCSEKAMSIRYCECVFTERNVHEPLRLNNIFLHFLINDTIFEKKKILNTKCVLNFLWNLSETLLYLRRIERDMIKNVHWFSCKVPVILCQILMKLEYSYQISYKSVQWEPSCTMQADRHADTHDEANNRLWQILQMSLKTPMSYLWHCLTQLLLHNWCVNSLILQNCGEGIIFWGALLG